MNKSSKKSPDDLIANIEYVLTVYDRIGNDGDDIETRFRKCIDSEIFKPRRLALNAMKDGVQLEGMHEL